MSVQNEETISLLYSIKYSGKIMWYYNKNQITKMKINKQEFQPKYTVTKMPEDFIQQVVGPFAPMIKRREINFHIYRARQFEADALKADWLSFQLSIFNLIQNAVKYNKFRGDIVLILSLRPLRQYFRDQSFNSNQKEQFLKSQVNDDFIRLNPNYILEVDIIDSGQGIEKEQQQYLFVPFLELKAKQDMKNVKNNSIGMGLSCSRMIMRQLMGNLELVESERGRTVFRMQMPVEKQKQEIVLEELSIDVEERVSDNVTVLFNYKRSLQV